MEELDDPLWSLGGKKTTLKELFKLWRDCDRCRLSAERTQIVFGNGNPAADILLIGISPGEHEDETGNAFVGESGRLLNALLQAAKIRREDLFITNIVMCRPPQNRDPMRDEMEACMPRLHEQIYTIDPILIVPVGAAPMTTLMGGAWKSITKERGRTGHINIPGRVHGQEIRYTAMPILHPSFINREDKINRETLNWEQGGWAHKTYKDLVRARQRVDWLKEMYRPAQFSRGARTQRGQKGLKVIQ